MPIPKTVRKGLSSIRTYGHSADRVKKPHLVYLKIGVLEMEKERRMVEKKNMLSKIHQIDLRCQDINTQINSLLSNIRPGNPVDQAQVIPIGRTKKSKASSSIKDDQNDSIETTSSAKAHDPLEKKKDVSIKNQEPAPMKTLNHNHSKGFTIRY